MMKSQAKLWITGYLILITTALSVVGSWVIKVDPFFHYHKPNTDGYFYYLNNQRSQNDGISKYFNYDALITGTSMTENFKTSEMDSLFGTKAIKVPYSGGTYKEINDNLKNALSNNSELKIIVRGLDMGKFIEDKDVLRLDLGEYPTYLYDDIWYNDIKYIFNRNVIFNRVYPMVIANDEKDFKPGITSFDEYSNWMKDYSFGIRTACSDVITLPNHVEPVYLSEEERNIVLGTIKQNITSLPMEYPDVDFYYFFPPYSILWWRNIVNDGTIYKQIEAEKLIIEEALKYENIKLYSFNHLTNIITDLNHYKDSLHYGSWINSFILRYMKDKKCLLTYDNYQDYLETELAFYTSYDYEQLNTQSDYENDYYAEALLNKEIHDIEPLDLSELIIKEGDFRRACVVDGQYEGKIGVQCKGSLLRKPKSEPSVSNYIAETDYVGVKITIDDISDYDYLVFYGIKNQDHGQPNVYLYDQNNSVIAEFTKFYFNLDNQWHQYLINVSDLSGSVTIVFHGGYVDNTGSKDSSYTFSNISLY